eukprot:1161531-Pelagomonas_calceolata.AAC.4
MFMHQAMCILHMKACLQQCCNDVSAQPHFCRWRRPVNHVLNYPPSGDCLNNSPPKEELAHRLRLEMGAPCMMP